MGTVRERWRVVVGGVLVGVIVAVAMTVTATPVYRAETTLYISARIGNGSDAATSAYQGSLLSEQRMKSYTLLVTSDRIGQQVRDELGLPQSARDVAAALSATAQPSTVILTIGAVDASPARAAALANAAAVAFARLIGQLERPPDSGPVPPSVSAQIVQPAAVPDQALSPRPTLNILASLLLGLLAGIGAAMGWAALDTRIKSAQDLTQLTGVPTLGTVDVDPASAEHPLTIHGPGHVPRAEAFRQIRTNLQFADLDHPPTTIVVTSASCGEGKTSTVCNVAIALASAGSTVVIVDGDLRRPGVSEMLGLDESVGPTSVLAGTVPLAHAIRPWQDGLLDVLTTGRVPPNSSEVVASRQCATVIDELASRYDYVLIDSPPVLAVSDAVSLSARCDGTLLVVRHGQARRAQVKAAVEALHAVSARLLGTILTMSPVRTDRGDGVVQTAPRPDLLPIRPIGRDGERRRVPLRVGRAPGGGRARCHVRTLRCPRRRAITSRATRGATATRPSSWRRIPGGRTMTTERVLRGAPRDEAPRP